MAQRVPFLPIEDVYWGAIGHFAGIKYTKETFGLGSSNICDVGVAYHEDEQKAAKLIATWKNDC